MNSEIDRVCNRARAKTKAILRLRAFLSLPSLLLQYKTHVWHIVEFSSLVYYHASAVYLAKIEQIQDGFLRELAVDRRVAFLEHNIGPLQLRREIAAQGFLHKIVLGHAHPGFRELFPAYIPPARRTRHSQEGHSKRFVDQTGGRRHELVFRSLFAAVRVYNSLPQYIVDSIDVSTFQRCLVERARSACRSGDEAWNIMYHPFRYPA